jgi:hypothetical protein
VNAKAGAAVLGIYKNIRVDLSGGVELFRKLCAELSERLNGEV